MKNLIHNKNPLLTRLILTGFLALGVFTATLVSAQTSGSALSPEAQKAYERGTAAAEQGEWELAIKYFNEAQELAPKSPEVLFNLAFACSNAGGRDIIAIAWFRAYLAAAPDAPDAAEVHKEIVNLEVRVEATIQKLIRLAKDTGVNPSSFAYWDIVEAQASIGDMAGAKETAANIPDDDVYRCNAYLSIVEAQVAAGDIAGAMDTAEEDIGYVDSYKSDAYEEIAEAQAKTGDIAGAKETATLIGDDYWKSSAYMKIAEVQAEAGDIAGARESLALAKKAAERIEDDYFKASAYESIAGAQAKVDKATASRKSTAPAKETTPAKAKYEASAEIRSWKFIALHTYYDPLGVLEDLQGFLKSLKGKDPGVVTEALAKAFEKIGLALRELQDNEVKWQELRAQSTP